MTESENDIKISQKRPASNEEELDVNTKRQKSFSKTQINNTKLVQEEDIIEEDKTESQMKKEIEEEYDFEHLHSSYKLEEPSAKRLNSWVWQHFTRYKISGLLRYH